jgi:hypothetical protein
VDIFMVSAKVTATLPSSRQAGGLGPVGDGEQMLGDDQGDGERRLHVGLVEARESPTGVGRFELGGGDDLLDAVDVGELRAVEAVQLVVEDPLNADQSSAGPRASVPSNVDGRPLHRFVVRDVPPRGRRRDR